MQPPYERFPFHHFQYDNRHYLAAGDRAGELAASAAQHFSPVLIRYAYPRYG